MKKVVLYFIVVEFDFLNQIYLIIVIIKKYLLRIYLYMIGIMQIQFFRVDNFRVIFSIDIF